MASSSTSRMAVCPTPSTHRSSSTVRGFARRDRRPNWTSTTRISGSSGAPMTSERLVADVLVALSAVHAGGHNLLTHLYGIERDAIGEGEAVGTIDARPQSLDAEGRFAATPTLMLADLTLGRSVKSS